MGFESSSNGSTLFECGKLGWLDALHGQKNELFLFKSLTFLCRHCDNLRDCLLPLRELLFSLAFVAPLVDFYLTDVELRGELPLLLKQPRRVLLERSFKNPDLYFPEAVSVLYGALLAAEVDDDFLLFLCFRILRSLSTWLLLFVQTFLGNLKGSIFFECAFDSWICCRSLARQCDDDWGLLTRAHDFAR